MVCGHDLAYNFASSATSTMESVVEFQRDQISKTLLKILEKKTFSPLIMIFLLELGSYQRTTRINRVILVVVHA